jgi:outer membrane protein assembly factor BamB
MKRYSRVLVGKILILVVMLVSGLAVTGCVGGTGQVAWSGAAIAYETLYVGSLGKIVAIKTPDGDLLWEETLETESSSGGFGCAMPASAIPIYGDTAVGDELVYAGGYYGRVYAYTIDTGAERWVYPRSGYLGSYIIGGTVLSKDTVYICTVAGTVYALEAETGDNKWDYDVGEDVWATPVIEGDTLYIGTFDKKLYAIDINTGEEKWQQPFETEGPVISTPVVYDNAVYVASFDRHIYALNKESGELLWQYPGEGGDKDSPGKWFWASPVLYNGSIYAANMDGKVYVLDADSGGFIATINLGGAISSTPVVVGDEVFAATEEGKVYAIDTASYQPDIMRDLELRIVAPLAADNGIVYIHTQEEEAIYALSAETGTIVWDTPLHSE